MQSTTPRRSARLAAKNNPAECERGTQLASLPAEPVRGARSKVAQQTRQRRSNPRAAVRARYRADLAKRRSTPCYIDLLPDEILWLVLGDFMEAPWHAVAGCVSRRWRSVLLAWAARVPRGSARCPFTFCQSLMVHAITRNAKSLAAWLRDDCACPMGPWAFDAAVSGWNYEWWARWLRAADPPCPWNASAIADSIRCTAGHALAAWMRAQDDPCPWHESACEAAVSVDLTEIAVRHGRAQRALLRAPRKQRRGKKSAGLVFLEKSVVDAAGDTNSGSDEKASTLKPTILTWLRDQTPPCPWNAHVCSLAAMHADVTGVSMLRWLRAQDPPCPWDPWVLTGLARSGAAADFAWAFDAGAPINDYVVSVAVSCGRIDVLAELVQRCGDAQSMGGRRLWTCAVSARASDSPDLKTMVGWLRDVAHCPFDERLAAALARDDRLDDIRWVHSIGLPLDAGRVCQAAASYGGARVLAWFHDSDLFDRKAVFVAAVRKTIAYDDSRALGRLVLFLPIDDVRQLCARDPFVGPRVRAWLGATADVHNN